MKTTILKTALATVLISTSLSSYEYVPQNENLLISYIAGEINRTLPQKINELVTLSSVKGVGNTLEFKGSFSEEAYDKTGFSSKLLKNFSSKELNLFKKEFISKTRKDQLILFCSNKNTRAILDSGIEFKYTYSFKSTKSYIGSVNVSSYDCNKTRVLKASK